MSDEPTKYFFRQRQQNRVFDTVIHALEEAGMRRKGIAAAMGVPPSQVTRLLSGPGNWTCDTISDLLFAIRAELDFQVVHFCDRAKGNRFHPEISLPSGRPGATTTATSVSELSTATWRSDIAAPKSGLPSNVAKVELHVAAE
jgi:hypothetical protein